MRTQRAKFSLVLRRAVCQVLAFFILVPAIRSWASSSSSESENPLKQLSLEQLGNVEVTTVSKSPSEVWKTAAAVYVITQDDIQRSGAATIPDALRLAPGVEVAQIDSSRWSIGIRGFGSRLTRDVLVLIDGRTVYTTLLAGTYWEVQNVLLADVDRIEIVRGPGGTIWGPNAVNGVINIITKTSQDTAGTLVSVGGGNVDQGFFNARFGGTNGHNLHYRVYAMGFDRGPEFHLGGQNYDRWRAAQGGFRADWAESARDSFTFQGDIYDEGAGESVSAISYTPPYSQTLNGTSRLSGGNILARWNRIFGEGKDVQLQAYYDRTNRHELNFEDLRDTFDVDFLNRFRLPGRQQISWGLGARASRGSNPVIVSGLTFQPGTRTDWLGTAFLQDDVDLVSDRLLLSLGSKFVRTNFTGLELEPSARLIWTPTDKKSIWAAFNHSVRTPSDGERDFFLSGYLGMNQGLPYFARFNANRNFRSEQLNGYELGYRQLMVSTLYLDLALFYNHYSDLFSEDVTGPTFLETDPPPTHYLLPAQFGNGLLGTTRGIEVSPEWKPTSHWRLRASYSFLQMELQKSRTSLDIGSAPIIEGSSPRHQVSAQSEFDFAKRFSVDLTYRFVSALPRESIQSYSTADAHFGWQLTDRLQLSVVGQNLMQPHHAESAGDPLGIVEIKRGVYGQVTWKQ